VDILVTVVVLHGLHKYSRLFLKHQSKIQTAMMSIFLFIFCSERILYLVQLTKLLFVEVEVQLNNQLLLLQTQQTDVAK